MNGCVHLLCFVVVAFSACLQMNPSPTKKKTPTKKSDKRMKIDHNLFRFVHHFERYRDSFIRGTIIQERFVNLGNLKDTFIPGCFEGKEWDKLLSDLPAAVCEPLIRDSMQML